MSEQFNVDYCIVGAGPSGLTAAYKLLQAGKKVLLIERDDRVGGLAKSYDYQGHIFDTGPKRFHTDDSIVLDFLDEIMQGELLRIGRSTKVFFANQYFEWPLQSKDLLNMPVSLAIRCFFDLLQTRTSLDPASFHEHVKVKYGETLFQTFFAPYTQKFLRWDIEDIHSDWATTGINRSVIDKRIQTSTLFDIFKLLMLPPKVETEFLYPNAGGFGGFYEILLNRCQQSPDFHLCLEDSIVFLEAEEQGIKALLKSFKTVDAKHLIWSGNLNDLCRLVSYDKNLYYLNTIFYNLICRESGLGRKKAQWIYVSQGDSLISRITCMKEFVSYSCPPGYYNIICELTDSQQKPFFFSQPERYQDQIVQELKKMSFLKDVKSVEKILINPVRDTYPIYHKKYLCDFMTAAGAVKSFSSRIHLLGRSGAFWYNNSDHSIRFAIELTQWLLGKQEKEFNFRDYFGGRKAEDAGLEKASV